MDSPPHLSTAVPPRPLAPLPSRAASYQGAIYSHPEESPRTSAAEVYRSVWDDFYRWKAENDKKNMEELCVPNADLFKPRGRRGHDPDTQDELYWDWMSDHSYASESYSPSSVSSDSGEHHNHERSFLSFRDDPLSAHPRFSVTAYVQFPDELLDALDDESTFIVDSYKLTTRSAFLENTGINPAFQPHPSYFSCTSTSRNLPYVGQSYNTPFSPFEDDLDFDVTRYLVPFQGFQWQLDLIDPDIEIIQYEAVRQLRHQLQFSFAQIDSLAFFTPLRKSRDDGLLWDVSQRDRLPWPHMLLSNLPELHSSDFGVLPASEDIFSQVKLGLKEFCPNNNCISTSCGLHRNIIYPRLQVAKPRLKSSSLRLKKGRSCSNHCFRYIDLTNEFQFEAIHWNNSDDIKVLEQVLQISPDILPCHLAVIMNAKCQDVFVYRTRIFPDDTVEEPMTFEEEPRRLEDYEDDPLDDMQIYSKAAFSPLSPCQHKGPCSRDSGCQCFEQSHHCQRNCSCSSKCPIRWKGCRCDPEVGPRKKNTCSTNDCPCYATARECDPDLCRRCDARGKTHKKIVCHNSDSQRAQYPLIEIKRGSWGLGAFATQLLRFGQPIGEYTGEISHGDEDTQHKTEPIAGHTGLNYKFDLNKTDIIDSMYMGNEMRYFNHAGPIEPEGTFGPDKSEANCIGKVVYVNNTHRIMFYAKRRIEAGSELFIDYGTEYWNSKDYWDIEEGNKIHWR
ncbi:hypothetical protein P691DRAFT_811411 [Macrolepiota fuliginosa MF-IS2]|uniref:SET domain-containing protein n=1 Tax=Macrolepiota fuliginosa MF-IS2 TaxID=1400762 RepID=A0A9P5XGJ9_9AGAR|nr:hypothetical protein P691DRAFT_811411 [Macrolepiota fuliginosa MF-IS2]